ncbi:DUF503 domain-containing protein [bacterium]|nr:DUF503 domain-containing protein [bacterium]MBU1984970.1 DUF503 domain-containing protein [bacterium]
MKCCLGLLTVELHLENSHSLKERRRILNSLKERIRQRFNVSVAEADFGEKWQRGGLMISSAGAHPALVEEALRVVQRFIEEDPRVVMMTPEVRFYE